MSLQLWSSSPPLLMRKHYRRWNPSSNQSKTRRGPAESSSARGLFPKAFKVSLIPFSLPMYNILSRPHHPSRFQCSSLDGLREFIQGGYAREQLRISLHRIRRLWCIPILVQMDMAWLPKSKNAFLWAYVIMGNVKKVKVVVQLVRKSKLIFYI